MRVIGASQRGDTVYKYSSASLRTLQRFQMPSWSVIEKKRQGGLVFLGRETIHVERSDDRFPARRYPA